MVRVWLPGTKSYKRYFGIQKPHSSGGAFLLPKKCGKGEISEPNLNGGPLHL
jgi:hypothetical protein